MGIKFVHINIIAKDWKKLSQFYIDVFDCKPKPPERDISGEWLDKLTSLKSSHIKGIHLQLPGSDQNGPTLEIFEYNNNISNESKFINKEGFGHIAFVVDNVDFYLNKLLNHGGSTVGELVDGEVEGVGKIRIVYAKDPEGNIIELQKWE